MRDLSYRRGRRGRDRRGRGRRGRGRGRDHRGHDRLGVMRRLGQLQNSPNLDNLSWQSGIREAK